MCKRDLGQFNGQDNVLQCVAVVFQCISGVLECNPRQRIGQDHVLQCVAVCCDCVAVYFCVLHVRPGTIY